MPTNANDRRCQTISKADYKVIGIQGHDSGWASGMQLVVIGGTGQLARSLAECALLRPDISLRVLARPEINLADPMSVAAVGAIEADVVINAAAYTAVDRAEAEPDLAIRINTYAAGELAAAARRGGARFVQISTDYVFDGRADEPYTEDALTNPLQVYGRSKLAGEEAVRSADPDAIIVRTAWVYSPFGHNFLRTMMNLARERDRVSVVSDQFGSPTSALDLAKALLAMMRIPSVTTRSKLYHLAGPKKASWAEFAEQIFAVCRSTGVPIAQVSRIESRSWNTIARRPVNSVLNSSLFTEEFGLVMPSQSSSVTDVVNRIKRNG